MKENKMANSQELKIGRYKILGELGAGGMSKVYRALDDDNLKRTVALKAVCGLTAREQDVARFHDEILAIARLDHANIVKLYDTGYDDKTGQHFYTMEFIDGCSLQKFIKDGLPKSGKGKSDNYRVQVVNIMIKVGNAIQHAHQRGVIHCDLKPANVMIGKNIEPKVMDFGLAKLKSEDAGKPHAKSPSRTEGPAGTWAYMSPEQAAGQQTEIDERSDVYALGAILYETLTGHPPFSGKNFYEIQQKIQHQEPMPPSRVRPGIPRDLDSICLKALAKNKQLRYASAALFTGDLCRYNRGQPTMARPIRIWELWWRLIVNHKKVTVAAACGGLLLGLGIWLALAMSDYKQQAYTDFVIAKAERLAKEAVTAVALRSKYPKTSYDQEISAQEERDRQQAIEKYQSMIDELTQDKRLAPRHGKLAKVLYELAREAGEIALDGRSYLQSTLFAEVCQEVGYERDARQFFDLIANRENQVRSQQLQRLEGIMAELAQELPQPGMVDEYVTEIMRMNGSHTVEKLLAYVNSAHEWQRRVSIKALGKLGDKRTLKEGRDAVEWLILRLEKLELSNDAAEMEEIVWALGRLKDRRADPVVKAIRFKAGESSKFGVKTKVPHSWLPLYDEQRPQNSIYWFCEKGVKKQQQNDFDGAIEEFTKAIKLDSSNVVAYNLRGLAKSDKGDYKGAIEDYDRAIAINRGVAELYNNRGIARKESGDLKGAIEDYDRAIAIKPRYKEAYGNRGLARRLQGNLDGALRDFDQAIILDPNMSQNYSNRGITRMDKGDLDGAIGDFGRTLDLNPNDAEAIMNRGVARMDKGDTDGAISDYNHAIRLNPRYSEAYNNRGFARYRADLWEEAINDYNQAIQLSPDFVMAYCNRGCARHKKGDIDGAIEDYTKAIALKPGDSLYYNNRGDARKNKGDLDGALQDCNQAIGLNPNEAYAYDTRGTVRAAKGDIDGAIEDFTKAIALEPDLAVPYKNRAELFAGKNCHVQAVADYRRYLASKEAAKDPQATKIREYIKKCIGADE